MRTCFTKELKGVGRQQLPLPRSCSDFNYSNMTSTYKPYITTVFNVFRKKVIEDEDFPVKKTTFTLLSAAITANFLFLGVLFILIFFFRQLFFVFCGRSLWVFLAGTMDLF